MADLLKTPDDRFVDLVGFRYDPLFTEDLKGFEGLRMHYIDEGFQDAKQVFLCGYGDVWIWGRA